MKWKSLILILCFIVFSPITALAVEVENYDYREEEISDFEEYEEICEMENGILETFDTNEYAVFSEKETKLDISSSVKVLTFDVNDFLVQLKSEGFIEYLENYEVYCWRIPVQDRGEKGADYAVAYVNKNGEWAYYTASSDNEIGRQQVEYIFAAEEIEQILSENKIVATKLYALAISNIGLDCIVVEMNGTVGIIPYAARPEFLGLENGKIYSQEEIGQKISNYMEESSYDFTADGINGGGGGGIEDSDSNSPVVYIVIAGLMISTIIFIVLTKRRQIG